MRALSLLVVLLLVAPARADSREEARKEFAAGQAADKRGDYQTAIEHYLRANDLHPHPFAIYNIAINYERLGQHREAATWFRRYLEAAPDSPDRGKVEKKLADLEGRPAKLNVRSSPDGARVLVDGAPVGVTPYAGVVRGGTRRIAVERDGQRDERTVTVEYGEPIELSFTIGGPEAPADAPPDAPPEAIEGPRPLGSLDAAKPKLAVYYLLGAKGGADLGGTGPLMLGSFGLRVMRYATVLFIGRSSGTLAVDLVVRWAFVEGPLSPFIGVGYSYGGSAVGYTALGGVRWDISQTDRFVVSLLADISVRGYSRTNDAGMTETGAAWPLGLSLELAYR
jgi:hypothetical protein